MSELEKTIIHCRFSWSTWCGRDYLCVGLWTRNKAKVTCKLCLRALGFGGEQK